MKDKVSLSVKSEPKLWVVIPAAGSGSRMQQVHPKQYLSIQGMTIIEHTLNVFLAKPEIEHVMVCIAKSDRHFNQLTVADNPRVATTLGGSSRALSVLNGVNALAADEQDWVLVHDAARPCLSMSLLDTLIQQLRNDEVGGILAVPANDTLKRANAEQRVESTIDRSIIWQAQTPQMFRYGLLKSAISHAISNDIELTDEASALESIGYMPKLVKGDARNLKVTTANDLDLAEFLLNSKYLNSDTAEPNKVLPK